MNKEHGADLDAKETLASKDTDAMNVPDAEQVRHDLFHAAVKRVLERHGTTLNGVMKNNDETGSRYKSLLTGSELRFLLR